MRSTWGTPNYYGYGYGWYGYPGGYHYTNPYGLDALGVGLTHEMGHDRRAIANAEAVHRDRVAVTRAALDARLADRRVATGFDDFGLDLDLGYRTGRYSSSAVQRETIRKYTQKQINAVGQKY